MGSMERLRLRWNDNESNFKQGLSELRQNEELFDVTLLTGSKIIKAHKVVLSACSPVFRSIIGSAPIQAYPLIYLRGIDFYYLELLLSFMYYGEVSVGQEEIEDFISIAQEFQIKGLSNYSPPQKRCEPQPSTSSNFSTDLTPYPPHDSHDPSLVRGDINDSLSKSLPNMEDEECCILDESNALEYAQKSSEQMETNNDSLDISIVKHDINNSLSKTLSDTENEECCILDENNTLELTQNSSEQKDTNKDALQSISSEQNQDYDEALNREIIKHYSKQKTGNGYECKKCRFKAQRRNIMHDHVEAKHIVTRGVICSICEKTYKTRRSLYIHKFRAHKGESIVFEGPKVIR